MARRGKRRGHPSRKALKKTRRAKRIRARKNKRR